MAESHVEPLDDGGSGEVDRDSTEEQASQPESKADNNDAADKVDEKSRQAMQERAMAMQTSLLALIERVESVKAEHHKLEGENKFLQSYIGELMSTSKIISTGAAKGKGSRSK